MKKERFKKSSLDKFQLVCGVFWLSSASVNSGKEHDNEKKSYQKYRKRLQLVDIIIVIVML